MSKLFKNHPCIVDKTVYEQQFSNYFTDIIFVNDLYYDYPERRKEFLLWWSNNKNSNYPIHCLTILN